MTKGFLHTAMLNMLGLTPIRHGRSPLANWEKRKTVALGRSPKLPPKDTTDGVIKPAQHFELNTQSGRVAQSVHRLFAVGPNGQRPCKQVLVSIQTNQLSYCCKKKRGHVYLFTHVIIRKLFKTL